MAAIEVTGLCKAFKEKGKGKDFLPYIGKIPNLTVTQEEQFREEAKTSGDFSMRDLNLAIPDGKTMVVLGPSGCGKSTLLRLIAGLEKPDAGTIRYDGVDVTNTHPNERRIGMVFQSYALFPNLSAKKNILSYFEFRKHTPELDAQAMEKMKKTSEMLGVEIEYLMERSPKTLSGGERQRVALGRCITRDPAVFLMDEPLSSLDALLREKYRIQLKLLLSRYKITAVYVTHDQQEAIILADSIALMKDGRILQVGSYKEIYDDPDDVFAAEFLNPHTDTTAINLLDGGRFGRPGAVVGVRPDEVEPLDEAAADAVPGTIALVRPVPIRRRTALMIRTDAGEIQTLVSEGKPYQADDRIWLRFPSPLFFNKASGKRIRTK